MQGGWGYVVCDLLVGEGVGLVAVCRPYRHCGYRWVLEVERKVLTLGLNFGPTCKIVYAL